MHEKTDNLLFRVLFSFAIAIYLVIWTVVFVFESRSFGVGTSIFLSLIFAIPFVIALRMLIQWHSRRGSEFVYLLILVVFIYGGVGYWIWDMYDKGQDRYYIEQLEFNALNNIVSKDSAFRNVELLKFPKAYWMKGVVDSNNDFERLKSLAAKHCPHIKWGEKITIINSLKKRDQVPINSSNSDTKE